MLRAGRTCVRSLKYQRIPIRFNSNNSNSDYPEEWLTRAKKEVGGKDPAEALSWTSAVSYTFNCHQFPRSNSF